MHDTEGETIESVKRERDDLEERAYSLSRNLSIMREDLDDEIERADKAERQRDDACAELDDAIRERDDLSRMVDAVEAERDAAIARAEKAECWIEDYKSDHRAVVKKQCAGDERHCSCVPHLRNELDELGIQLEALRERMQLAMAVVSASRLVSMYYRDGLNIKGPMGHLELAIGAFFAVPGGKK